MNSLPHGLTPFAPSLTSTPATLRRPSPVARSVAFTMLFVACAGCTTPYHFKVDALRSPGVFPPPASFVLSPVGAGEPEGDALFREIAPKLSRSFSALGMYEVVAGVAPDITVAVAFNVTGPIHALRTRVEPEYLVPPTVLTSGRVGIGIGAPRTPVQRQAPILAGVRTVVDTVAVFRKTLELTARDVRGPGARVGRELWRVTILNEDESGDVSLFARLMAAAAIEVIHRETDFTRAIVLVERDGRVMVVRRKLRRH